MSAKENTRYTTGTGGQAKYIKFFEDTATEHGLSWDLSTIEFETKTGKADFIKIWNTGSKTVYVAFDVDHTSIDTSDSSTYNIKVFSGTPFSEIAIDSEVSMVSLKCASGETSAIKIMAQ